MAKSKKPAKSRDIPKLPAQKTAETPPPKSHALRETVESIVIAFVLAFLFRTFEAEAFVIPTGSMAPTLMGRHKDVDCPKCGYRYQVSASEENPDNRNDRPSDCVAGMCPMCHYVLPMLPPDRLPGGVPELRLEDIAFQRSYNGDRILVNKYNYTFAEPQRWDVVVFKFPGDAKVNYIKRLVGLPGETLRIFHGDLFVGNETAKEDGDFEIAHKPADKVLAMRQLVHDTAYDPAELDAAGWPLRWRASANDNGNGWNVEKTDDGTNVRQTYSVDATGGGEAWLRYNHFVPDYYVWQRLADGNPRLPTPQHRLITDANPYNGREDRDHLDRRVVDSNTSLEIDRFRQGLHWVGDLMVEADIEVKSADGELLLDLVEGGRRFTCRIDLKNGQARLAAEGAPDFAPSAKTNVIGPGSYRLAFANFDDQLLLWVDNDVVTFEGGTAYDAKQVFGDRRDIRPETSDDDLGDFAPAGIGSRDAKLTVDRLKVWRDIYYIADDLQRKQNYPNEPVTDFDHPIESWLLDLPTKPSLWDRFTMRNQAIFPLGEDQFFVMGDNSAESSDARLWRTGTPDARYLERRLLIGKALSVYWPHSWNRIPGTPIPFPLFPNFADMRLVR
ncbi:MAG: signal peptidase I [Planctomycetes bacterium]|nr:signal peptidase I [Planctomycetota bacterium]